MMLIWILVVDVDWTGLRLSFGVRKRSYPGQTPYLRIVTGRSGNQA